MSIQIATIRVDSTLNPGSGETSDVIHVSVNCGLALEGRNGDASAFINVPLPPGTIVQDVKKAERGAYDQASQILTQLADAARKEALL